jgi:hypothetical protein
MEFCGRNSDVQPDDGNAEIAETCSCHIQINAVYLTDYIPSLPVLIFLQRDYLNVESQFWFIYTCSGSKKLVAISTEICRWFYDYYT